VTYKKANILVPAAPKALLSKTLAYASFLAIILYPLPFLKYEAEWLKEVQCRRTVRISVLHSFIESLPCTRISFCAPEVTTRWTPAAGRWTRGPLIQAHSIHCCSLTLLEGCLFAPCCDGFDMNAILFITTSSLWYVFILTNVTHNVMSSFVRIIFDSYEVIYMMILTEEMIQSNVGQTSKCLGLLV
jgi:hypothetical protein